MADTRQRNQIDLSAIQLIENNAEAGGQVLICLSPASYAILRRLSDLAGFWNWWQAENDSDYSEVDRLYYIMRDELHKTMCLEELTDTIDQQTTDIVNAINNLPNALKDIMSQEINFNPTITQEVNVGGCGGGGSDPTPNPTPTPDPNTDPPDPSTEPNPIDNSNLEYRCKASGLAINSLINWWTNARNNAELSTDFVSVMTAVTQFIPALKGYSVIINGVALFIATLTEISPLDEIIEALDSRKSQLICILYEAINPMAGREGMINYLWNELLASETMPATVWAILRLTIDLIDWEAVYTLNAIDVSNVIIAGNCQSCNQPQPIDDPIPPPEPDDPLPASYSAIEDAGYCLIEPTTIERINGDESVIFERLSLDSFAVTGSSNNMVRPNIGRPNINILGIVMNTTMPQYQSGLDFSILNNQLYDDNGFVGTTHLPTQAPRTIAFTSEGVDLTGIVDTASGGFVAGNNDFGQAWFRLNSRGNLIVRDIRYIYECTDNNNSFYLETDSNYLITPPNWLISGGQTFIINDNTANDGTPIDTIPNLIIESGLIVNGSAVKFIDWQSTAPTVIKLSAYRIQNQFGNSPKLVVLIRNHGEETIQSRFVLDMVNENEVYTLETPLINSGQYDIEIIGTGPGGDGPLGNVVVYDVSSQ